jgi:TetR/AcrR family transcriptional regulator, transcriptional repressor of bet genes
MNAPIKRTAIEDIRRIELIQAAHRVFMDQGLSGLTTARICNEAGMSPGILAYYFKGKDEVLLGMVRYNNRLLLDEIVSRMKTAVTRWERLMAIVEGNFPKRAYVRNVAQAWLSVCAAARPGHGFERLQAIFYRRLESNLRSTFANVLTPQKTDNLVLGVGVMIDGLWLRKSAGSAISSEDAAGLIAGYLTSALDADELFKLQSR